MRGAFQHRHQFLPRYRIKTPRNPEYVDLKVPLFVDQHHTMKVNVANPATGAQKLYDFEDDRKT